MATKKDKSIQNDTEQKYYYDPKKIVAKETSRIKASRKSKRK